MTLATAASGCHESSSRAGITVVGWLHLPHTPRNTPSAFSYKVTGKCWPRTTQAGVVHRATPGTDSHSDMSGQTRSVSGFWASDTRSEEHTSELQSLMRTSYAVFCLKK